MPASDMMDADIDLDLPVWYYKGRCVYGFRLDLRAFFLFCGRHSCLNIGWTISYAVFQKNIRFLGEIIV